MTTALVLSHSIVAVDVNLARLLRDPLLAYTETVSIGRRLWDKFCVRRSWTPAAPEGPLHCPNALSACAYSLRPPTACFEAHGSTGLNQRPKRIYLNLTVLYVHRYLLR